MFFKDTNLNYLVIENYDSFIILIYYDSDQPHAPVRIIYVYIYLFTFIESVTMFIFTFILSITSSFAITASMKKVKTFNYL